MKISEYTNLNEFLTVFFNFLKENGIHSSMKPVENYTMLLARILKSKFNHISYNPGMYSADFILSERIEVGEVYYFIFGSTEAGGSLLIDLGERELSSFFNFTWDTERHPPFLKDFIDGSGRLKLNSEVQRGNAEFLDENDIFSFEEFST